MRTGASRNRPGSRDELPPALVVRARAKLNIGLQVLGRRRDGYHDIRTFFQSVDLSDTLWFRHARRARVLCPHPRVPGGGANLCVRALTLLEGETGRSLPLEIRIEKSIPVGGGLGGGSSNAAATLWAANRLFGLGLSRGDLAETAAEIGADVPFFFRGGTCRGEGIGDRIEPVEPLAKVVFLLVVPPFTVDTGWAYGRSRIELTSLRRRFKIQEINKIVHSPPRRSMRIPNDFLDIVGERYPILFEVMDSLEEGGALATSMSGTGSALYGIFLSRRDAERASRRFRQSDCEVRITRPVRRGFVSKQTAGCEPDSRGRTIGHR